MRDLRGLIDDWQANGQLKVVDGADADVDIGALAEVSGLGSEPPALLFDKIKGYPPGYRVLINMFQTQPAPRRRWELPIPSEAPLWLTRSENGRRITSLFHPSWSLRDRSRNTSKRVKTSTSACSPLPSSTRMMEEDTSAPRMPSSRKTRKEVGSISALQECRSKSLDL